MPNQNRQQLLADLQRLCGYSENHIKAAPNLSDAALEVAVRAYQRANNEISVWLDSQPDSSVFLK